MKSSRSEANPFRRAVLCHDQMIGSHLPSRTLYLVLHELTQLTLNPHTYNSSTEYRNTLCLCLTPNPFPIGGPSSRCFSLHRTKDRISAKCEDPVGKQS